MFPPSAIPYLDHPCLEQIDSRLRSELLTRHLYQYLNFTANLEPTLVNRGVQRIAANKLPISVIRDMRLDALKIYTDEGYHALFSIDLISQIEAATGVIDLPYDFEPYLQNLDRVTHDLLSGQRALGELLQVIIFETAVSSILSDLPEDPNLVTAVRSVIRDHATDEKTHHAFFMRLFPELWTSLSSRQKHQVGLALPRLIVEEVRPYKDPIADALVAVGLDASSASEVLHDTYTNTHAMQYARHMARYTVHLFAKTGVLDIPGASDAFAAEGLL